MVGLHLLSFFEVSLVDRVHELGADLADGSLREKKEIEGTLAAPLVQNLRQSLTESTLAPDESAERGPDLSLVASPNKNAYLARKVAAPLKRLKISEVLDEWHAKTVARGVV